MQPSMTRFYHGLKENGAENQAGASKCRLNSQKWGAIWCLSKGEEMFVLEKQQSSFHMCLTSSNSSTAAKWERGECKKFQRLKMMPININETLILVIRYMGTVSSVGRDA